jgi:hypothetical protein
MMYRLHKIIYRLAEADGNKSIDEKPVLVADEFTPDGQAQRQAQSVFEFVEVESGDCAGVADKRAGLDVMGLCIHESSGGGEEDDS